MPYSIIMYNYCYFLYAVVAVSFNQRIYTVNEADRLLEVLLVLSNSASFDVTVTVFNTDGSAIGKEIWTCKFYI